jgi:hypothetical protein
MTIKTVRYVTKTAAGRRLEDALARLPNHAWDWADDLVRDAIAEERADAEKQVLDAIKKQLLETIDWHRQANPRFASLNEAEVVAILDGAAAAPPSEKQVRGGPA